MHFILVRNTCRVLLASSFSFLRSLVCCCRLAPHRSRHVDGGAREAEDFREHAWLGILRAYRRLVAYLLLFMQTLVLYLLKNKVKSVMYNRFLQSGAWGFLSLVAAYLFLSPFEALAHDTWVQTNTAVLRKGDSVHIDFMLGNHGNDHRDYKLAGKIGLDSVKLSVLGPDSVVVDLKDRLKDVGYAQREGYWTAKFTGKQAGLYTVAHTLDKLHGSTRVIKSAKCYFSLHENLDAINENLSGHQVPLGHDLELVPLSNPLTGVGPGKEIRIQVLYQKKPLENARVTFIPRGVELAKGFDSQYERTTKSDGIAAFSPSESGYYLISVHHLEPTQSGTGYEKTAYGAALTLLIPEFCPLCKK